MNKLSYYNDMSSRCRKTVMVDSYGNGYFRYYDDLCTEKPLEFSKITHTASVKIPNSTLNRLSEKVKTINEICLIDYNTMPFSKMIEDDYYMMDTQCYGIFSISDTADGVEEY